MKLPDKLSDLLELAVTDAEAIEKTPGYVLDMNEWHKPNGNCRVCMAGAVIARTLGVAPTLEANPNNMEDPRQGQLFAIDSMRTGDFCQAARDIDVDLPGAVDAKLAEFADEYEDLFVGTETQGRLDWGRYREAVAILREAGL